MLTLLLPLEGNQIEMATDQRRVTAIMKGCTLQEVEEIFRDLSGGQDPLPQPKGNRLQLEAVGLRCQLEFPNGQEAQWAVHQMTRSIRIQWEEARPESPQYDPLLGDFDPEEYKPWDVAEEKLEP